MFYRIVFVSFIFIVFISLLYSLRLWPNLSQYIYTLPRFIMYIRYLPKGWSSLSFGAYKAFCSFAATFVCISFDHLQRKNMLDLIIDNDFYEIIAVLSSSFNLVKRLFSSSGVSYAAAFWLDTKNPFALFTILLSIL